jgi:hypothetical protein
MYAAGDFNHTSEYLLYHDAMDSTDDYLWNDYSILDVSILARSVDVH